MRRSLIICGLLVAGGCGAGSSEAGGENSGMPGTAARSETDTRPAVEIASPALPAGAEDALDRINASPRHAEWVTVRTAPGDSIRAWLVYPERNDAAPVVVVVHEIFGLSHWIRAVADQFAADGFIAIAPDLLTMENIPTGAEGEPDPEAARAVIGSLDQDVLHQRLIAVAEYAMDLPAAAPRYGIVGYCWGGAVAFEHAIRSPELGASVVYYGTSPDSSRVDAIRAPVLGLYGENDERVNATIAPVASAMAGLGKEFEYEIYSGAGHGFLRAQNGQGGANRQAAVAAWPRTIEWFRTHLEGS